MIKIEKGIPIPKPRQKWPFQEMEIGDSFFAKGRSATHFSQRISRLKPRKFTCRTVDGGVRIWRVE